MNYNFIINLRNFFPLQYTNSMYLAHTDEEGINNVSNVSLHSYVGDDKTIIVRLLPDIQPEDGTYIALVDENRIVHITQRKDYPNDKLIVIDTTKLTSPIKIGFSINNFDHKSQVVKVKLTKFERIPHIGKNVYSVEVDSNAVENLFKYYPIVKFGPGKNSYIIYDDTYSDELPQNGAYNTILYKSELNGPTRYTLRLSGKQ